MTDAAQKILDGDLRALARAATGSRIGVRKPSRCCANFSRTRGGR